VKVINGKIARGVLVGDFEMASLLDNKQILGNFDTRGNLVQVTVNPSVKEPDATATLIAKELLKLSIQMTAGQTGSVLAATTDEPLTATTTTPVLNQGVTAAFFQVKQNTTDGSLTVVPQNGAATVAGLTTVAGPQGPAGPAGTTGATGATGPSGGPKGDKGIRATPETLDRQAQRERPGRQELYQVSIRHIFYRRIFRSGRIMPVT